jgi:hypothetical protein
MVILVLGTASTQDEAHMLRKASMSHLRAIDMCAITFHTLDHQAQPGVYMQCQAESLLRTADPHELQIRVVSDLSLRAADLS